jgi:hypothetical protein
MGYKVKNGRAVRRVPTIKLFHFTPPARLPFILEKGIFPYAKEANANMLPGGVAVWLTSNPNGNTILPAHVAAWRKHGKLDLIEEYESGKRKFLFGEDRDTSASARITVELPKGFEGLFHYLELMTVNFQDRNPELLAAVGTIHGVEDWWIVGSPADGESCTGIGPGAIREVHPVGDPTPDYLAAVNALVAPDNALVA